MMKRLASIAAMAGSTFVMTLCMAAAAEIDAAQVKALHALITPASDALFQAESQPPATSAEWAGIAARAADLVRAAKGLESAKGQVQWLQFARAFGGAAEQAARAAKALDQEALVSANSDIVSACEDCHTVYRDGGRSMK
jgi:cytochrome c556